MLFSIPRSHSHRNLVNQAIQGVIHVRIAHHGQTRTLTSDTSEIQRNPRYAIKNARPFSEFLTDSFGRQHDYLRISLTERCNLRCLYCMPEDGIQLSPDKDLLTSAEIYHLSALFVKQGVTKIRLTGGEPTVRKDIVTLMQRLGTLRPHGMQELAITTNGIALHRKLDDMVAAGLTGVNISLDTLDPFQFQILTRRQGFHAVMRSIDKVKELNAQGARIKLKINCVVMRSLNDHQVLPFVEMTRTHDLEVRFIEYMPFGGNKWNRDKMMSFSEILASIKNTHPGIHRLKDAKNDTSKTWQVPGFLGRVGFITSMTHNFCGTCNRLRITSDGNIKVCLHGLTEVSLRDILRKYNGGEPLGEHDLKDFADGQSADEQGSTQHELLRVIGAAVKGKKAGHAGMEQLEHMENRPMILIGGLRSPDRCGDGGNDYSPVAVLTVLDMCKAMDTKNVVSQARVVYKAGAKNDTFVDESWKVLKGQAWLNTFKL
ncbi:molybdenum cofactor biosynthesis prote [Aureobasidium pullulans]|uniref:GTP 3',8-cyclase n=1 Tax=Aureobasidium pullulans TaxID=5580 RepID=A0A4T0BEB6_AURPU|nr:molybdenum cofactor biosynthesis prote [Aureobasidium pullulans]